MKTRYKQKTSVFGTDAEWYMSRLLLMIKNPHGSRRPDLISCQGDFFPRFSMEVKSGRLKNGTHKGTLVDYQNHYGVTSAQDYETHFGEQVPESTDLLPGFGTVIPSNEPPVAFYYNVICRPDKIDASEIDRPYAALKLEWRTQYWVPHEFAFYMFAVTKALRTRVPVPDAIEELREMMRRDILTGFGDYETRKKERNCWQDLHANDIAAVFFNDNSLATKDGKERLRLMGSQYAAMGNLKPFLLYGPHAAPIFIVAKPEHENLFDTQVRARIHQRASLLEKISKERGGARRLLSRIKPGKSHESALFGNGEVPENHPLLVNISPRQRARLERLVQWLDKGEWALTPGSSPRVVAPF